MAARRLHLAAVLLGLAVLLAPGAGSRASAQGHTPDPFNGVGDYNIGLAPFLYSTYPNPEAVVPNQAALQGRTGLRQSNRLAEYLDDVEGPGFGDGARYSSRGRAGVSYERSYRQLDEKYNRSYLPNEQADRGYYERQQDREDLYGRYLREADPRRRAQLYRELSQANLRSARALSGTRAPARRGTAGSGSEPPPPPDRGPAPGPVAPTPLRSRTARPSPAAGTSTARPGTNALNVLQRSERMGREGRATAPAPGGPSLAPR